MMQRAMQRGVALPGYFFTQSGAAIALPVAYLSGGLRLGWSWVSLRTDFCSPRGSAAGTLTH